MTKELLYGKYLEGSSFEYTKNRAVDARRVD